MRFSGSLQWLCRLCVAALALALALASPALAEKGKLRQRLTPQVMAVVYPGGAERLGDEEGQPPAIPVYKGDQIVAYIFSTLDIIAAPGYSTTPFDVIAGVDLTGHITGAKVVFHNEPHILDDPARQRDLDTFLARQAGRALRGGKDPLPPDYVADSTVSARAMRTAVLATASLVLRPRLRRGGAGAAASAVPTGDADAFQIKGLEQLVTEGAVVRRRVTSGELKAALEKENAADAKLDWPLGRDEDLYIEFVTALATPEAIGGNLLGVVKLEEYKNDLPKGAQAIYLASSGPYDFIGPNFSKDHRFDRFRLVQGGKTFSFAEADYTYTVPTGGMQLAGLFVLRANSGFDGTKPWRLELLVRGAGAKPVTVAFGADYKLPDLSKPTPTAPTAASTAASAPLPDVTAEPEAADDAAFDAPTPDPAWVEAWNAAKGKAVVLGVLLSVLTLIFIFQAQLARHRLAHRLVRNGFLLTTLVWLGWTARVQLSTVNVINYVTAPFKHLDFGFYLAEPLMLILATYTLFSVLLIGRGMFCGWLCPFGALQELLGQVSRALNVPQWAPSVALEKRLWMGKYIAAVAVLFLVISGIDATGATMELEPFKTAITSKFTRPVPYVIYAGVVIAIGLFSERAYCRFLCPLGGLLAILDRLHLLNLLKRRPECGSPCHLCERSCPVRAIVPSGKIITSECFQCLDCQVEYYDDKRCPPLVKAAKLRAEIKGPAVAVKHA